MQVNRTDSVETLPISLHERPSSSVGVESYGDISAQLSSEASSGPSPTLRHSGDGTSTTDQSILSKNAGANSAWFTTTLWYYQIGACSLSVLAMVAIYIFLLRFDGKTKPQWPYEITLNTILSIFTMLLKACLLLSISDCISQSKWIWFLNGHALSDLDVFDSASRGVLGSLHFLYDVRFRHFAALGGTITIFSLSIDPFIQQCVQYTTGLQNIPLAATIPVSKAFNTSYDTFLSIEAGIGKQSELTAAILDRLLNPASKNFGVSASCQTGSCNFTQPYSSLAWCARCSNISPKIQGSLQNSSVVLTDSDSNPTLYNSTYLTARIPREDTSSSYDREYSNSVSFYQGLHADLTETALNVSLLRDISIASSGVYSGSSPLIGPNEEGVDWWLTWELIAATNSTCLTDWMDGWPRHGDNDCFHAAKLNASLNQVEPIGSRGGQPNLDVEFYTQQAVLQPSDLWPNITAASCSLTPCVKTYTAEVKLGSLEETLLHEANVVTMRGPASHQNVLFIPMVCNMDGKFYNITDLIDIDISKSFQVSDDIDRWYENLRQRCKDPKVLDKCIFVMDHELLYDKTLLDIRGGGYFVDGLFSRLMTDPPAEGVLNPWNTKARIEWDSNLLGHLFEAGNISTRTLNATFQNIATAMTNFMRNSDVHGSTANGDVFAAETLVRVSFPWLVLPTLLVIAGCLFLGIVVRQANAHCPEMIWKSSQVALMHHGLRDCDKSEHLSGEKDMEEHSKKLKVKLAHDGWGWRFALNDDKED